MLRTMTEANNRSVNLARPLRLDICLYRFPTCRTVLCARPEFYVAVIRAVANRETKVDTREAGRDSRRIPRT